MEKIHFISGLPRAGSTLLSTLLRQNPKFCADIVSPVHGVISTVLPSLTNQEFDSVMSDEFRERSLRGLFDAYYPAHSGRVVFDSHRLWTASLPLLSALFPQAKVICCVREIGWILDSVERMLAKNPMQMSGIFQFQRLPSVYQRVEAMMNPGNGFVGLPLTNLREAWFSRLASNLVIVRYERLAEEPDQVIRSLYELLEEPWFEHRFHALEFDAPVRDAAVGMPGLHNVRPTISVDKRLPGIPPDLFNKFVPAQMWSPGSSNPHNVRVL